MAELNSWIPKWALILMLKISKVSVFLKSELWTNVIIVNLFIFMKQFNVEIAIYKNTWSKRMRPNTSFIFFFVISAIYRLLLVVFYLPRSYGMWDELIRDNANVVYLRLRSWYIH